ncbi:hypothetical protein [Deinococcus sp.]|uniref:hypothetical protein n=1 Tax=Deinococcus sp. TaxID=47478 RepID=UPI003B5B36A6
MPPLFRFRDIAIGVFFLFFATAFRGFPAGTPEGIAFRIVYFWLLFIVVRRWWRYRRRMAPQVQAYQAQQALVAASRELAATLSPHLGQGYALTSLDNTGVRLTCPSGTRYHVYALAFESDTASVRDAARQQATLARSEGVTILRLDHRGGAALIQGQEIILHTGASGLAEQVEFWEQATLKEQAIRQRGLDVEARALDELDRALPTWQVRRGLLMRRGGDVDAVLTRPDGLVFCLDVKSHRGTPHLVDGVLHLGRTEKGAVLRQLRLQAQETGGLSVCWQPEADYGDVLLEGVMFVGGPIWVLLEVLVRAR